ncbi:MAG: HlyD family type I secretion periplasmic adaptor subunit [Sphingopyxis sp.]|nr:HlyD family type I secretion periplasmic adaptor subunit [Sphingopyxis sp.]
MTPRLLSFALGDRRAAKMAGICLFGLGGFLLWAGLVPLQQGVSASGVVVVQDKKQIVQHLEGGIIEHIAVKEGQYVRKGAILMRLRETASHSERDKVVKQVAALSARVQRLIALQDRANRPDFSSLEALGLAASDRQDIIARETKLFDQQRQSIAADLAVLDVRRRAAVDMSSARGGQAVIARRSLDASRDELDVVGRMAGEQLARRDQVTALQRNVAGSEGEMARLMSESREAQSQAGDLAAQGTQLRAQFDRQIATDLVEARNELRAAEEFLNAAQDVVDRGVILAPVSGAVLNLAFNTRNGVVRPGEPIMEIVPSEESVTASVHVRPTDRAAIREGQEVRTQVLAYRSWLQPQLKGRVVSVSADLKTDPASNQSYYEAIVKVAGSKARPADGPGIVPGMPVQVFIYSGARRTTLDYLLEPVFASLFRGLRST